MLELSVVTPTGQVFGGVELPAGRTLRIGRARDCEIRVADPLVSRHHAEILATDNGRWVLRDAGSRHGCVVRGQRIGSISVTAGLEVRIGKSLLRFENLASRIGQELDAILDAEEAEQADADDRSIEIIAADGRRVAMDETLDHAHPHAHAHAHLSGEQPADAKPPRSGKPHARH